MLTEEKEFLMRFKRHVHTLVSPAAEHISRNTLNFGTLLANTADDKLVIFFLFFPENRICHFMQIVSRQFAHELSPDNMH